MIAFCCGKFLPKYKILFDESKFLWNGHFVVLRSGTPRTLSNIAHGKQHTCSKINLDDEIAHGTWETDPFWDIQDPLLPPVAKHTLRNRKIIHSASLQGVENGILTTPRMKFPATIIEKEYRRQSIKESISEISNAVDLLSPSLTKESNNSSVTNYGEDIFLSTKNSRVGSAKVDIIAEAYKVDIDALANSLSISEMASDKKSHRPAENNAVHDNTKLTPAQLFFHENREKLILRAQEYHDCKVQHFEELPEEAPEKQPQESSAFDTFYRDPVIRPAKNHLWDAGVSSENHSEEEVELEQGRMPTIEQIVKILSQERVQNITIVDLDECGRRDLGMYYIIGTGQTGIHCESVGKLLAKLINRLKVPYVSPTVYCWGSKDDNWALAHCGPLQCHILTKEMREKYKLENMLLEPHKHFSSNDFAGFFDSMAGSPPPYVADYISMMKQYDDNIQRALLEDGSTQL